MGEILAEAERYARECEAEAEREAAATESAARADAERLFSDARSEAQRVARERTDHLAAIQAALAARGPALLEGLEGSGATRARLEALIAALAAAADRVVAEADADGSTGDSAAGSSSVGDISPDIRGQRDPDDGADAAEEHGDAEPEPAEPAEAEASGDPEPAEPAADADEPEPADHPILTLGAASRSADATHKGEAVAGQDSNGSSPPERLRYDGPLPEGAPLARKPRRTKERDIRFAALVLALQGRERADVEKQLCSDYSIEDCSRILDEVFGRPADARA